MGAFLRRILITIIVAVVIFLLLQATVQSSMVVGSSMEPNLEDGQRLLINKAVYIFHQPERGDVIVFQRGSSERDYIKRIIGLPGDVVEIKGGIVYIHKKDGEVFPLDEPYIAKPAEHPFEGDIIPENEYFVLGDNRNISNDSRNGWTVKREDIIGKAWLSVWPLGEWGLAPNHSFEE